MFVISYHIQKIICPLVISVYMTILFVKNDENKNYDNIYTNNKKVRIFNIL